MRKSIICLTRSTLLGLCLLSGTVAAAEPALFNADGYRQTQYRSPTPPTADGARTLDTASLQQLLREQPQTVLIDVFRQQWLNRRFIPDTPPHGVIFS